MPGRHPLVKKRTIDHVSCTGAQATARLQGGDPLEKISTPRACASVSLRYDRKALSPPLPQPPEHGKERNGLKFETNCEQQRLPTTESSRCREPPRLRNNGREKQVLTISRDPRQQAGAPSRYALSSYIYATAHRRYPDRRHGAARCKRPEQPA